MMHTPSGAHAHLAAAVCPAPHPQASSYSHPAVSSQCQQASLVCQWCVWALEEAQAPGQCSMQSPVTRQLQEEAVSELAVEYSNMQPWNVSCVALYRWCQHHKTSGAATLFRAGHWLRATAAAAVAWRLWQHSTAGGPSSTCTHRRASPAAAAGSGMSPQHMTGQQHACAWVPAAQHCSIDANHQGRHSRQVPSNLRGLKNMLLLLLTLLFHVVNRWWAVLGQ